MIRFGIVLAAVCIIFFLLSITISYIANNLLYVLIIFAISVVIGVTGQLLVLIGVLKERIKEKKEEDQDDVSKY